MCLFIFVYSLTYKNVSINHMLIRVCQYKIIKTFCLYSSVHCITEAREGCCADIYVMENFSVLITFYVNYQIVCKATDKNSNNVNDT